MQEWSCEPCLIINQVDKPSPNKTVQSVAIAKWHDKNYLQLAAAKLPIGEIASSDKRINKES